MASTYSTNLALELVTTGEQSGTWGTTTNTNLGTLVEQAIVGQGSVIYAADANKTITITNGASSAARCFYLNVTSSLSLTATRELVVPTINKNYLVYNATSGSQSITVKTTAGTGVTVPNGKRMLLQVDGTNVIESLNYLSFIAGVSNTVLNLTAVAGTNTITATASPTPASYIVGQPYSFSPAATNTGAVTLNVSSLGARAISKNDSSGLVALIAGDLTLGNEYFIIDNGTVLVVLNPTASASQAIPSGAMMDYAGAGALPSGGWLLCDGSAVSRATYSALFTALSTTWGSGDGSTTFNLPDSRRRISVGSGGSGSATLANTVGATGGEETHTLIISEMPSHTHTLANGATPLSNAGGGGSNDPGGTDNPASAISSTGGGGAHNNIQPSYVVQKIIKT